MTMETTDIQITKKYPKCMNCAKDIIDGTGYRLFKLIEETPAPIPSEIKARVPSWFILCSDCYIDEKVDLIALASFKEMPESLILPEQPILIEVI